jgi:hypothetical protein
MILSDLLFPTQKLKVFIGNPYHRKYDHNNPIIACDLRAIKHALQTNQIDVNITTPDWEINVIV